MREFINIIQKRWFLFVLCLLPLTIVNIILFTSAKDDFAEDLAKPLGNPEQIAQSFSASSNEAGGGIRFELKLDIDASNFPLAEADELQFLLGTHNSRPRVIAGEIKIADSACVFLAEETRLLDNQFAHFVLRQPCEISPASSYRANLVLILKGTSHLSLWMRRAPLDSANDQKLAFSITEDQSRAYAIGLVTPKNHGEPITRLHKLAYMWDFNESLPFFLFGLELLFLIWSLAVFKILAQIFDVQTRPIFGTLISTALLLFSSSGLISVLTPPLQAPDEPDHLLGYLQLTGQSARTEELKDFAKNTHFERIKFQREQFFRASDIGAPYPTAWASHVSAAKPQVRSSTITFIWSLYHQLIDEGTSIAKTILSLRLFNAVLWGLCLLIPLLLAATQARNAFNTMCGNLSFFLAIPVLSFFSMYISDFSITVVIAVSSTLLLSLIPKVKNLILVAVLSGLLIQLSLAGNKAGAAVLIVFLPLAWHGLYCRSMSDFTSRRSFTAIFKDGFIYWTITGLFAYLPLIPLHTIHLRVLAAELRPIYTWIPRLREFITVDDYYKLALALAAVGLVGYLLLGLMGILFLKLSSARIQAKLSKLAGYGLFFMMMFVVIFPIYSLFSDHLPSLQNIEVPMKPDFLAYFKNVFKVILTSLRLNHFDFYMQSSFWGGFGWLDTIPNRWYLAFQNGLFIVLILQFLRYWRRTAPLYGLVTIGFWMLASLTLIAFLAYFELHRGSNLHGRYLIPAYVFNCGLLLIRPKMKTSETVGWVMLLYPVFWTYVLMLLLHRYLG